MRSHRAHKTRRLTLAALPTAAVIAVIATTAVAPVDMTNGAANTRTNSTHSDQTICIISNGTLICFKI